MATSNSTPIYTTLTDVTSFRFPIRRRKQLLPAPSEPEVFPFGVSVLPKRGRLQSYELG